MLCIEFVIEPMPGVVLFLSHSRGNNAQICLKKEAVCVTDKTHVVSVCFSLSMVPYSLSVYFFLQDS